jgi:hypothetical protein
MTKLHLIAGITPNLQHLLEAGGIASVEDLARQDPGPLSQRLKRSAKGQRGGVVVSREELGRLIGLARKLVDSQGADTAVDPGDLAVDLDRVPEAISVPAAARPVMARPIAARPAVAPGTGMAPVVPVAAVPAEASARPVSEARPAVPPPSEAARAAASTGVEATKQKFRDFQAYEQGITGVEPLPRKAAEDEEEMQGAMKRYNYQPGKPIPRLVRRGVPYPRPFFLVFGSLIVLASRLLLMAVIIGTPLVLWPAFVHGDKTHLIKFLWVIGAWLVSVVFYLLFPLRARCRVCTNHLFWSKRCFKNQKAHRLWGLGLVGSLALHALLFGWFRCMYCGTAIRLKFVADPERAR